MSKEEFIFEIKQRKVRLFEQNKELRSYDLEDSAKEIYENDIRINELDEVLKMLGV